MVAAMPMTMTRTGCRVVDDARFALSKSNVAVIVVRYVAR
jgi:hypothetical protein